MSRIALCFLVSFLAASSAAIASPQEHLSHIFGDLTTCKHGTAFCIGRVELVAITDDLKEKIDYLLKESDPINVAAIGNFLDEQHTVFSPNQIDAE